MNKCSGGSRICKVGSIPMGVINLLCGIIFAENYKHMNKIGLRGGVHPSRPLDPPMKYHYVVNQNLKFYSKKDLLRKKNRNK